MDFFWITGIALVIVGTPIFAFVAFLKTQSLERQVNLLTRQVQVLSAAQSQKKTRRLSPRRLSPQRLSP